MTQVLLNAKGERPSSERVLHVLRKSLNFDSEAVAQLPPIFISVFTRFLTSNPGDTNFLLELPDAKDPSIGGNGFGLVTCIEDDCWCDLVLEADPTRPDGGRADGFGSLDVYAQHCNSENHRVCRDTRMKRQGMVIPGAPSSSSDTNSSGSVTPLLSTPKSMSTLSLSSGPSSEAGPSRLSMINRSPLANAEAGPSWKRLDSSASGPMGSSSITPSNSKNAEPKPVLSFPNSQLAGSSSHKPFVLNEDDSDDEILFLGSKPSNRPSSSAIPSSSGAASSSAGPSSSIVVVDDNDDSDDDVKPITPSQFRASVKPPHVTAWLSMSITERLAAVNTELEQLQKLNPSTPELKSTIKLRRGELKIISKSFGIRQWTPPAQAILKLIPKTAIAEKLRDAITWPDPPAAAPTPSPVAPGAAATAYVDAMQDWHRLDRDTRQRISIAEQQYLSDAYTRSQLTLERAPMLKGVLMNRILEAARRVTNPDHSAWTLPTQLMLTYFPGIKNILPPMLQRHLSSSPVTNGQPGAAAAGPVGRPLVPPAPGMPGMAGMPGAFPGAPGAPGMPGMAPGLDPLDMDFGFEHDRPVTQQGLTDFFQDALEDFKEDATVDDGLKTLKLDSISDKLPGANFTLLAHQVLGVAFMVKREERDSGARGGLLCDAMGLGKTVQTLGIMLARQERPDDYKKAPQLIVAPVALLAQWKAEIESKTSLGLKVYIHHGAGRVKSVAGLKRYDVVLTSYGTLRSEAFPQGRKGHSASATPMNGSDDDSDDIAAATKSPLLSTKWFRVVLDEAHNVRNKSTNTSKAVMALDVLHPWFLTGTPVVNSLKDLAPALRFIGAMDIKDFDQRVGRLEKTRPKLATKRCQAILRPLMMRRNKQSKINGVHILQLPPKTTNLTSLMFEDDERAIYAALEARARMRVNKFIQEGTLMKNYSVVLVLLTRLRQCVNHPWLLRRKPGEEGTEEDQLVVGEELFGGDINKCCANDADEYGRAIGLIGAPAVHTLKKKLEERYQRVTNESEGSTEGDDMECSICYEPFDGSEVITACSHIYCKTCLDNLFTAPIRDASTLTDDEAQRGCRVCPMCRGAIIPGRVFRCTALYQPPKPAEAVDDDEIETDVKPRVKADPKGKKRAAPGQLDAFFNKKLKLEDGKPEKGKGKEVESDDEIESEIPPSTKMKKLLALLQGYLAENPTVKVLVFSQFVSFLDLLSDYLNVHGIKNIGYRGSMNQAERSEAIRRFSMPAMIADSIPVMLISTKAGGVGLNLTMASKVICCDLAWNPATEDQAVDRAHRIGQSQPVTVERLVIADTVEDRLLEIQKQKGALADGALGEGGVAKLGRLTLENIRTLFAMDSEYARDDADD